MLLEVSLAGGGQLDGNKLVATKRVVSVFFVLTYIERDQRILKYV